MMAHILAKNLRRAIRLSAIQGQLTERNPSDTDINVSYKKALLEKENLINNKMLVREKPYSKSAKFADHPFDISDEWIWVRFGDLTINKDSQRIPVSRPEREKRKKVYDYYGASGVIDKIDDYIFEGPNLLIGEDGANLLARSSPIAFLADGKYWVNNHAHVLNVCGDISLDYLCLYINSIDLSPYVTGSAQPKMNQENMNAIWVPLPSVEEQKRIVAKVHELMSIIDEYEKIENQLVELCKQFPGDMRDAVLQAAMHGKLTEQLATDSPLQSSPLFQEDKEGEIPKQWKYAKLKQMADVQYGYPFNSLLFNADGNGMPLIRIRDILPGETKTYTTEIVSEDYKIRRGNMLVGMDGNFNVNYWNSDDAFLNQRVCKITSNKEYLNQQFLYYYLSLALNDISGNVSFVTVKHLSDKHLSQMLIPIPPLEEQQRIVDKLEHLLPLCDNLEEMAREQ